MKWRLRVVWTPNGTVDRRFDADNRAALSPGSGRVSNANAPNSAPRSGNPPRPPGALRENGRMSLTDPATGWSAELMGFGADNTRSFAKLLEEPSQKGTKPHGTFDQRHRTCALHGRGQPPLRGACMRMCASTTAPSSTPATRCRCKARDHGALWRDRARRPRRRRSPAPPSWNSSGPADRRFRVHGAVRVFLLEEVTL